MEKELQLTNEQLRKLQLTELEILVEFDRVCEKNNIQYSLYAGTLLGAVRHKGFIPWDDDIDIIMLRAEYEKFFEACKKDLDASRFFLQEYRTDKSYRWGYEKIRRKNTLFVRVGQEHIKCDQSIFMDIFVADNVPNNKVLRQLHLFMCFCIRKILYSEVGKVTEKNGAIKILYKVLSLIPRDFCFWLRNIIANFCNKFPSELISHMTHNYPKRCRFGLPAKCFYNITEIEFEGRRFKAFRDFDCYLTPLYGDYMKLPPIEERVAHSKVSKIRFLD